MNDLGELLVLQEKPEEALELFEETLELEYEVLGKSHPYTFETLNNLAQLKEDLGLLDEAFEIRIFTYDEIALEFCHNSVTFFFSILSELFLGFFNS